MVVIANPAASQFTGGSHRDVMASLSEVHRVEAMWPANAEDATRAASEATDRGADVVVAMGGDGMVHHVSQGLIGRQAALGIIPAGTTNVIARLLHIPSRVSRAVRLLTRPQIPRTLGVVRMTLTRGDLSSVRHAIFACGLGFDAEVIEKADADPYRKYRFGSLHYARTAIGVALGSFASRKPNVSLRFDEVEEVVEAATAVVQFREVYTYFGRVPIRLADDPPSPMTVLTQDRMRRTRVPQLAFDAIAGRDLRRVKGVRVFEGVRRFEFTANPAVATQADGERFGLVDAATFEWAPNLLGVIAGD